VSVQAIRDFAERRPAVFFLAVTALVSVPFILFPRIDVAFSALFFHDQTGFWGAAANPTLRLVRKSGEFVMVSIAVIALISLLYPLFIARSKYLPAPRNGLFLLTTLALGPGLLVNLFFKEVWGRARPREILEFGGDLPFSRAWEIVPYCDGNCSFVSGEGSSSIWMMAIVFLVPHVFRLPLALVVFAYVFVLSLNRIVFGGHFLSDVVLSWTITLTLISACYVFFYRGRVTEESVNTWFDRARGFLRAPLRLLGGKS